MIQIDSMFGQDTVVVVKSIFDTFDWSALFSFLGILATGLIGLVTLKINRVSQDTNRMANGDKDKREKLVLEQQQQIRALSDQIATLNAERLLRTTPPQGS